MTEIKIFLADNSTKSALVNELFAEYTDAQTGKARELLGFGKERKMPRFVLYSPINFSRKTAWRLIGKTSNAGKTRVTLEGKNKKQVPSQFYIGRANMEKFTIVIDKATNLGKIYC